MVFNRGRFTASLTKWSRNAEANANSLVRSVALEGFKILVRRSPVMKGKFRGNWRVAVGKGGQIGPLDLRADFNKVSTAAFGQEATLGEITEAFKVISAAKFGDTISITNNMPYARKIERGTASPTKAPLGVLRLSFLELKIVQLPLLIEAAKNLRKASL